MLGSVVAGRFKIERKAGAGGMGTVYRAHDILDGSAVALKLLASEEIRDTERFAQEAAIVARLNHPAIVRYIAHGVSGGHHFLAMEWLDGLDLDAHIDRNPLSLHGSLLVLRRTAEALGHAHQHGIIHRDIKPANIFLPRSEIRALKLLDFGVARLLRVDRKLTKTGMLVGTPGYLAPEVISGARTVDARTDLFALGCVGFRCLTGRAPFDAPDATGLLGKILMEDAPPVQEFAPGVPDSVAALIAGLLQRNPQRRTPDVPALLAELDALGDLGEQPPAYRQRRKSISLTLTERRLVCVVMLGPPWHADVESGDQVAALKAEMKDRFSATVQPQPDGALLIVLPAAGKATDLAVLAARAALRARQILPDRPAAVACGQAPVSDDPSALEDILVVARDLLQSVPAGQIRLQDLVAALVEGRLSLFREQQQSWLSGERDVLQARRPLLGKATEFVGRNRELASLLGMVTACTEDGTAQVALAVGPAGIGKSRLLHELLDAARRQVPSLCVLFGAGDPLASGSAFGSLARAIRRHAGIRDGEPIEESRRKLDACLAVRLSLAECPRVAAFLGELAHVPFPEGHHESLRAARSNPQLMGDLIRRAFEDWLKAESAAHPVLLVLEDLQWGDAGTVGLVDSALRNLRELPVMVLGLGRPEVRQVFPDLWTGRGLQVLELGPLARKSAEKLVQKALGSQVSAELVAQILTRADGNPFFLEELIRAASAGRTDGLPESVLGMVHARLDAEGEQAKRILRAASIFGDRFSRIGLASLLGGEAEMDELSDWLERLIDRELLSRGSVPEGAEGEFTFLHGIVREAAYSTLTEPDRVMGHGMAGEHLEAVGCPDAMVLAEHFRLGQQLGRSVRWYRHAAEQALRASDLAGAITRADLGLRAAATATLWEEEQAWIPDDAPGALRLTLAEAFLWRGEFGHAEQRGTEAVAALPVGTALWYRAVAQSVIAVAKQGKVEELAGWVKRAVPVEPAVDARDAQVACFAWAISYLLVFSRQAQAEALMARVDAIVISLADPDPQALALVHQAEAAYASLRGDPGSCLAALKSAEGAFARSGDTRNAAAVKANIGFMLSELGQWQRAEEVMREALASAEAVGLAELRAVVQHNLGRVISLRGDLAEGERLERLALESFVKQGEPRLEGLARLYLADMKLLAQSPEEAEQQASVALRVLSDAPAARIQARAVLARAQLAQGKHEALENARAAADELEVLGSIDEGEAEVRLIHAQCLAAAGDMDRARAAIARAVARLQQRAAGIFDPELKTSFLRDVSAHARTLEISQAWKVASAAAPGEARHGPG